MHRRVLIFLLLIGVVLLPLAPAGPIGSAAADVALPTTPQAPAPQAQDLPPGGFIEVSGSQLVRFGQPVFIRGVNYYPQGRPWNAMWQYWNAPQMERELRLAREQLGINAVRILVPYGYAGRGNVNRKLLERIQQFLQIAGNLDIRVNITLFDQYNTFGTPDSDEFARDIEYVRKFVGNFVGDERIFAWDVHNEPDHYPKWAEEGQAQQVLQWLGLIADEIKRIAPYHLVTVGMGKYDNLWQPGPDGRTVIDYSDVVSVHIYNAADAARQLDELRARTGKPILIQEFGWPTGAPCTIAEYNETQQAWVYQAIIEAAVARGIVGVMAWTLRDYDPGPHRRY
ncbi:MAG: cellulase family glycosylhydrolase, partial [Chloroflexaceae bacterium]|nr:cellulase family glycosylhydrolase [Chloroflexaceae bacterium]